MNALLVSWKTTLAGVSAILVSLGTLAGAVSSEGGISSEMLTATITGIVTGIGLLTARDSDKSSQDTGARR